MDTSEFRIRIGQLTAGEIAAIAEALRHEHDSADGEVAWWRATVAVTGTLRRSHRTREASAAARAATDAVRRSAERAGVAEIERSAVTLVARAAADVARALVAAEDGVGFSSPGFSSPVHQLLAPWAQLDLAAA